MQVESLFFQDQGWSACGPHCESYIHTSFIKVLFSLHNLVPLYSSIYIVIPYSNVSKVLRKKGFIMFHLTSTDHLSVDLGWRPSQSAQGGTEQSSQYAVATNARHAETCVSNHTCCKSEAHRLYHKHHLTVDICPLQTTKARLVRPWDRLSNLQSWPRLLKHQRPSASNSPRERAVALFPRARFPQDHM